MTLIARPLATLAALAALVGCGAGAAGSPENAPSPVQPAIPVGAEPTGGTTGSARLTTGDGIFSVAQAARGRELFDAVCSECHETADWVEAGFRGRWEGQSVFQLWYYINDRMPYDDPFSLTRQQVSDMVAYILELNDLPAGGGELGTDDDTIDDYWIAWSASR